MSTAEFILAFVRFVNRYGIPLAIYSDNAKSFLQAGGLIQNLLSSSEFEEKFRTASISHKTIPVYAAWYGAVWERMIKTVKECFAKVASAPGVTEAGRFGARISLPPSTLFKSESEGWSETFSLPEKERTDGERLRFLFRGGDWPRSPEERSGRRVERRDLSSRSRSSRKEEARARELDAPPRRDEDTLFTGRSPQGDGVPREEAPADEELLALSPNASNDFWKPDITL